MPQSQECHFDSLVLRAASAEQRIRQSELAASSNLTHEQTEKFLQAPCDTSEHGLPRLRDCFLHLGPPDVAEHALQFVSSMTANTELGGGPMASNPQRSGQLDQQCTHLSAFFDCEAAARRNLESSSAVEWWRSLSNSDAFLEAYETPLAMVTARAADPKGRGRHEELASLINRGAKCRSEEFSNLLLLMFLPMLIRLRANVNSRKIESEDLNQIICLSFLQVLQSPTLTTLKSHHALCIRSWTSRRVFAAVKKARLISSKEVNLSPVTAAQLACHSLCESDCESLPELSLEEENAALEIFLEIETGDLVSMSDRNLIIQTKLLRVPLRKYAAETLPSGRNLERHYQALKRRRSRIRQRAFELLVPVGLRHGSRRGKGNADRITSKRT